MWMEGCANALNIPYLFLFLGTSGQDQADLRQQAAKEMRLQNAYSAGRPDGSGFPPLSLLNPMLNQSKR